jgi:hemerythrin
MPNNCTPPEEAMNPFELEPTFETGHSDFDRHIGTPLAIANEVLFSKALEESPRQFHSAVAFLVAHLDYHFASRQGAMAKEHYPSRHFHSAFHAHVPYEATAMKKRAIADGAAEEARHTIYFMLEDRLIYHVQEDDWLFTAPLRQAPAAKTIARLPAGTDPR